VCYQCNGDTLPCQALFVTFLTNLFYASLDDLGVFSVLPFDGSRSQGSGSASLSDGFCTLECNECFFE